MHTSSRLTSTDFVYRKINRAAVSSILFSDLFPDYHPLDRVGVVAPCLEDGPQRCAAILLSVTTEFYNAGRSQSTSFFDYPRHFGLIGGYGSSINTRLGSVTLTVEEMGQSWGWLDVWPESAWVVTPPGPVDMLDQVFRHQINRLLWPSGWMPALSGRRLPDYYRKMMAHRLKSVWYYGDGNGNMEIQCSRTAEDIIRESLERLPPALQDTREEKVANPAVYRIGEVEEFLQAMSACFDAPSHPVSGSGK
jgi:hypothetical protein